MLLGAAVIVIVGFLVVNYFRNLEDTGTTLPTGGSSTEQTEVKLPTKHTVAAGETLWSIAEKYYKSGYNWVDIQKENKLTDASIITKGQELTIPDVQARNATVDASVAIASPSASPVAVVISPTPEPTASVTATLKPTTKGGTEIGQNTTATKGDFEGTTYTVVHGDNLWKISVKAYGTGYKWMEIALANKLVHPGVIHAGNVLQIPR